MRTMPVKSADRTLDIFELFAAEPQALTIAEISDRLGLARSSTHGLVHTLAARGYLVQDGGGRFQLGARLIQLGLNVVDRLELRWGAWGTLERLVAVTHDTALLVVPDHGDLLFADKVLSDARDVRTDPRVSSRKPLHCTSLGKALLATLDDISVMKAVQAVGLARATEYSITGEEELLADLADTRARGYSIDQQEALPGVFCVRAPVLDYTGDPVAAISLSTIKEFFDPDRTGPLVNAAAVEISHAMGWRGHASSLYEVLEAPSLLLPNEAPPVRAGIR